MKITLLLIFTFSWTKATKTELFPGFIAQDIGKTTFIQGFLDIEMNMKCPESLYWELKSLHENNIKLQNKYILYLQNRHRARFPKTTLDNIPQTSRQLKYLTEHLQDKTTKLDHLLENPWIQAHEINSSTRNKRGFFNLGGEILKTIFGTATSKDLHIISKKVDLIVNSGLNSEAAITKLSAQIHDNTKTLSQLRTNQETLYALYNVSISSIDFQTEISTLNLYLTLVNTIIEDTNKLIDIIQHTLTSSKQYHTPLNIYSYKFITTILNSIKHKTNLQPTFFPTPNTLYEFLSHTWTIPHLNLPYQVSTLIPFVTSSFFDTFKIFPFPTYHNLSSSRIAIQSSYHYFFLNRKELTYTYSKTISPDHCRRDSSLNLCIPTDLMHTTTSPNCIISLLLHLEPKSPCNYIPFQSTSPYTLALPTYTSISMPKPITASVSCPKSSPQLVHNQLFSVPHGCKFISDSYNYLHPSQIKIQADWLPTNYSEFMNLSNFSNFTPSPPTHPSTLHLQPVNIHWNKQLDSWNKTFKSHHSWKIIHISVSGFSAILSLLVLAIFLYFLRIKYLNTRGTLNTNPPPLPNKQCSFQRVPQIAPKGSTLYPTQEISTPESIYSNSES